MSAGLWGIDRFYYRVTLLYECKDCGCEFRKSDQENIADIRCPKCSSIDIFEVSKETNNK